MLTLNRLLLAVSICCLVATANAEPIDDAIAAHGRGDYAQTLKILRPLAAQGYAFAQSNIGYMYENGQGVTQDYQEALKWYRLAATQGYATAQNNIGGMYASGQGVTQDYKEAGKWFRLAAAQGIASAQYNIGVMYRTGQGATQDYQEALKWFRLAAAQGDVRAQYNIGWMYYEGRMGVTQDYQEALKWFRLAAAQGESNAQTQIGVMYYNGQEVTQNYQEALKWFRLAAAQGDAPAQTNIGYMYYEGQGVTQDYQEALKWSRLAAAQGFAGAQNNIGAMYRDGRGVARDDKEAVKWFRLSAEQGTARGQFNLGFMYRNGRGVTQDDKEALRWFKLAAANGEEKAIAILKSPESPPKLVFNSSTPKADGTVELSGRVISDASISEISINGRALEVSLGRDNSFTVTRGLPMGAVTSYRLSVMDEYGQKAETEINVERAAVQYAEQVAPLNPRKLKAQTNPNAVALIIGIEAYSRLPQAQYADSDATHFYDYANQSLGVPPHKIKLLTDTKANRIDLLLAMRSWMRTEVNGKSDVYIFFAGHGLASADGSKTYLLPADGDRDLLDETSILRDDLIASAKGAKTITMFLDTCYSGGTRTNEVLLADARPIAIVPEMKSLPSNVTVLAAASGAQLSSTYEAAQQGLFSYWLMKGLEGDADANKDKKITAGELHEYVAKQVGPMAQTRNRQQNPQLMGESQRVLVRLN